MPRPWSYELYGWVLLVLRSYRSLGNWTRRSGGGELPGGLGFPEVEQGAGHWVGIGKWKMTHAFDRGGGGGVTADVPLLIWRIGAHYQKVQAGGKTAMAGAGRKERVSCADRRFFRP